MPTRPIWNFHPPPDPGAAGFPAALVSLYWSGSFPDHTGAFFPGPGPAPQEGYEIYKRYPGSLLSPPRVLKFGAAAEAAAPVTGYSKRLLANQNPPIPLLPEVFFVQYVV